MRQKIGFFQAGEEFANLSPEELERIVLGEVSPNQERAFRELWFYDPQLAVLTAALLWKRTNMGIRVKYFLLEIAREVEEGGPVMAVHSGRVYDYHSLEEIFNWSEPFNTIEISFSPGKNGLASLSALARMVTGTPFEEACLRPAKSILLVGRFPTFNRLFRFSIPEGMPEEEERRFMSDLAWAIWPGVSWANHLFRLKPAPGSLRPAKSSAPALIRH